MIKGCDSNTTYLIKLLECAFGYGIIRKNVTPSKFEAKTVISQSHTGCHCYTVSSLLH